MDSKTNKEFLKHLKSKPKPELGTIEYDDFLIGNLSVNTPVKQECPTIIICVVHLVLENLLLNLHS